MIQRINYKEGHIDFQDLPPDVTRAEREYLAHLEKDNEDPSKRHCVFIRCWLDDHYEVVRFYEPTHEVFQLILSEFAPLWNRTQVTPACLCPHRYYHTLLAMETIKAATSCFQFTQQLFVALKEKKLPRNVLQRLKDLKGQYFFTQQEAADAILTTLQDVLTEAQIKKHGDTIMQHLKQGGIDEDYRKRRISELRTILDEFHGHVPQKPYPPTHDTCPHCHLPYRYTLLELLPYEQDAIQRAIHALVGAPVMFRDIPKVLEALELWLFASDTDLLYTKKKLETVTMTGLLMIQLKQFIQTMKQELLVRFSESVATMPDLPASVGSSLESPPPPAPDASPPDN